MTDFLTGPTVQRFFAIALTVAFWALGIEKNLSAADGFFALPQLEQDRSGLSDESSAILRGNFSSLKISPFTWRAVGDVYGEWGNWEGSGSGTACGFSSAVFGGSVGADRQFGKNVIAGFKIGGADIALNPEDSRYDGSLSSFHGLVHIDLSGNLWYGNFGVGVGQNRNRFQFPEVRGIGSDRREGTQWNYETEIGLRVRRGYTKIEPFFGMRYINLDGARGELAPRDSYSGEDGASSLRSLFGSRFHWEYATYIATLKPSLWGLWVHEYDDRNLLSTNDLLDFPVVWRFGDHQMPRDRMILGVGMAAALRDMVDLWMRYDSAFSGNYSAYTLSAGVNVKY